MTKASPDARKVARLCNSRRVISPDQGYLTGSRQVLGHGNSLYRPAPGHAGGSPGIILPDGHRDRRYRHRAQHCPGPACCHRPRGAEQGWYDRETENWIKSSAGATREFITSNSPGYTQAHFGRLHGIRPISTGPASEVPATVTIDVWDNARGLPVKILATGSSSRFRRYLYTAYGNFNKPVTITPPPA